MPPEETPESHGLLAIVKFIFIKIPLAMSVFGIWFIAVAMVMIIVVGILRVFGAILEQLSDGIPFNLLM